MCRLGFHKWQNYGEKVQVSWQVPERYPSRYPTKTKFITRSEVVYEGRECERCGMKLRRKFVTNSDGTLSCIGWEPDNEEGDKEYSHSAR